MSRAIDLQSAYCAILYLRAASDCLVRVGAKKSAAKVRRALKSAEGAQRHVLCKAARAP